MSLGFEERVRGSHHIFSKDGLEEILNLQPKQGKAKAYQVKQVRVIILQYKLVFSQKIMPGRRDRIKSVFFRVLAWSRNTL